MDEKPTVQMDASQEEPQADEGRTPSTIPIDDMYQEPDWQPRSPEPTPRPFSSQPPAQEPTPRPFRSQPPAQPPRSAGAGQTVIMKEPVSTPVLAWLAVTEGPGAPRGQVYTLAEETVIGRKVGQIVLSNDAYVSGQHAKIRLEPSEEDEEKRVFVLYDLASANGTFAGDREDYEDNKVYRHELEDGDFVLLGETTLVFKQVRLKNDE
jgi:hypothetical protein